MICWPALSPLGDRSTPRSHFGVVKVLGQLLIGIFASWVMHILNARDATQEADKIWCGCGIPAENSTADLLIRER
jgi:hypothetical protein